MGNPNIIWLASYPRSGNTFLRTILWHCFGLHSASLYPEDLGGNKELEAHTGHIEHDKGKIAFPSGSLPLVKTHEHAKDSNPAIYIIRDGRAASVSLWQFYNKGISLEAIVEGRHRFGTWGSHVTSWNPWVRPNTLLLRYEDIINKFPENLEKISAFLARDILSSNIPARNAIASQDGRWVKGESDWRRYFPDDLADLFNRTNKDILRLSGYSEKIE